MKIKLITAASIEMMVKRAKYRETVRQNLVTADPAEVRERMQEFDEQTRESQAGVWLDGGKLEGALEAANGKAAAHTYIVSNIRAHVLNIEKQLGKSGIPASRRSGIKVTLKSGVPTAKAYARNSRTAIATQVELLRGTDAWFVTNIARIERYTGPGGDEKVDIVLTPDATKAVIDHALSGYSYSEAVLP